MFQPCNHFWFAHILNFIKFFKFTPFFWQKSMHGAYTWNSILVYQENLVFAISSNLYNSCPYPPLLMWILWGVERKYKVSIMLSQNSMNKEFHMVRVRYLFILCWKLLNILMTEMNIFWNIHFTYSQMT
jgi:hypothetical protein